MPLWEKYAKTHAPCSRTYHHVQQSPVGPDVWLPQSQNVSVPMEHCRERQREQVFMLEPASLHSTVTHGEGRDEEPGTVDKLLTTAGKKSLGHKGGADRLKSF